MAASIDYIAINGQVAQVKRPESADGKWRIVRFLRRRDLMDLPVTTGSVRPQESGKRRAAY